MALSPGTRLGAYEVVAPLGVGGMGEVYRARDTRLKRDVAIKVLPEAFSQDPDRLGRFQREAELLASLNHPNIAAIYGLEKTDSGTAIVLELVDGDTLAEVIARGPVAVSDALPVARAIADALEAAHDKGIVHRDLKPANVKITTEGKVKVLDFGLAKAVDDVGRALSSRPAGRAGSTEQDPAYGVTYGLTQSPTITTPAMTYAGVILGTAAYMSPEQARGKPVDRRADVWAFGCVLFEMLTGRRTFDDGETVSDAIAAILKNDPEWTALPPDTPAHIRTLLKRCLQKDLQKRLPHIGVVRLEIDEGPVEAAVQTASPLPRRRRVVPLSITAAATALVAAGLTWWLIRSPMTPQPVTRFTYTLPVGETFSFPFLHVLTISPDGKQMVYIANRRLYLRSLDDFTTHPINGTEIVAAGNIGSPVFAPDGRSLVYWMSNLGSGMGALKRISVQGGAAITFAESVQRPVGISWGDGGILVGGVEYGILRVSPNGGTPERLIPAKSDEWMVGPQLLPGGESVLFTLATPESGLTAEQVWSKARIVVQSLKTGQRKVLIEGANDARYLPTGHLVYAVRGVLMARTFDARAQAVSAEAIPVIEGVALSRVGQLVTGAAQFSVSNTGTVVYVPGPVSGSDEQQRDLVMVDRAGAIVPLKLPPALYQHPRVSPDGKQLAYQTDDGKRAIVWTYDLSGRAAPRQLTLQGNNRFPIWSHDSQRVTYQSDRSGKPAIYWEPADGSSPAERLIEQEPGMNPIPNSWTPDNKNLLFENGKAVPVSSSVVPPGSIRTLWTLHFVDKKVEPFGQIQSVATIAPIAASVSRDGQWLAYTVATEGTRAALQTLVQQLPNGSPHLIATGAADALWHPNGRELFFNSLLGQFGQSATITTRPQFAVSNPVALSMGVSNVFRRSRTGLGSSRNFDVMPDGEHFIAAVDRELSEGAPGTPPQINVVLNWFEELNARVPAN